MERQADSLSSAHTCQHCDKLILDASKAWPADRNAGPAAWAAFDREVTIGDMRQWAEDDCAFSAQALLHLENAHALSKLRYRLGPLPDGKPGFQSVIFGVLATAGRGHEKVSSPWVLDPLSFPDGAAARVIPRHPVNLEPGSRSALALAQEWLDTCLRTHEACSKHAASFIPKRVLSIDYDASSGGIHLRLLETHGRIDRYAALSYCWGGEQKLKTTTATLARFQNGIALDSLPATIRDAVTVTHKLGLRYLFVDAFCIVQDDDDDKQDQIAQMPSIYGEATVTILAARARSVEQGFLQPRSSPLPDVRGNTRHLDSGIFCQLPLRCPSGELDAVLLADYAPRASAEPLEARAWTLQEQLVARRTLSYGGTHTAWRCWTVDERTDGWQDAVLPGQFHPKWMTEVLRPGPSGGGKTSDRTTVLDQWYRLVRRYALRRLSFSADKLPAISAIAARVGTALQDEYLAGLWKCDFPRNLFWAVAGARQPRPSAFRAPTWSWAAVDGAIYTNFYAYITEAHCTLQLLEHNAELVSPKVPYGAVRGGSLVVRGRLRPVVVLLDDEERRSYSRKFHVCEPERGGQKISIPISFDATDPELEPGKGPVDVTLLEVCHDEFGEHVGLVLRDLGHQTFSRLGIFHYLIPGDGSGSTRPSDTAQLPGADKQIQKREHLNWMKQFDECSFATITII